MLSFKDLKNIYLIAEIGINHNGDLEIAKKLIDAVSACQWSCAKFQKREPDICIPTRQKNIIKDTPWGKMTYLEYRKRMEFGKEQYDYIERYCKEKPIDWTASVWDIKSLEFMTQYKVPFIKIPSAKITDLDLVEKAAKTRIPIIASTGMSTIEEIDSLVDMLKRYSSDFAIMHTNASYPSPQEELNLNCINTLKKRYNCVVGYSGHEYNVEPTVYACVMGAKIIERHITLSHYMWGTDHVASLEIAGMDLLRKRVKDIDIILGNGEKRIRQSERKVRLKLRDEKRENSNRRLRRLNRVGT